MEMFGNPITGYTTGYYSELIEKSAKVNEIYFNGYINGQKVSCNGKGCYGKTSVHYQGDRGNKNSSSKVSQKGLEKRASNYRSKEWREINKKSMERGIKTSFNSKIKSHRWAKRHKEDKYTPKINPNPLYANT